MKTVFVLLLSLLVFTGCEIEKKGDANINMKEKDNSSELSYEEARMLATDLANKYFESTLQEKGMITSEFWFQGKKRAPDGYLLLQMLFLDHLEKCLLILMDLTQR